MSFGFSLARRLDVQAGRFHPDNVSASLKGCRREWTDLARLSRCCLLSQTLRLANARDNDSTVFEDPQVF